MYGKLPAKNKVPNELPREYKIELTPAVPEFKSKFISFGDILTRDHCLVSNIVLTLTVKLFEFTNDYPVSVLQLI